MNRYTFDVRESILRDVVVTVEADNIEEAKDKARAESYNETLEWNIDASNGPETTELTLIQEEVVADHIKPGCVQHDCDQCQKDGDLLAFLSERMMAMEGFIRSDNFGPSSKLINLEAILRSCAHAIRTRHRS